MKNPKVVKLIRSYTSRGKGTPQDLSRWVEQYFTLDGELVFEIDPAPSRDW